MTLFSFVLGQLRSLAVKVHMPNDRRVLIYARSRSDEGDRTPSSA